MKSKFRTFYVATFISTIFVVTDLKAAPLLGLLVEGSTSGQAGSYSTTATPGAAGSTYYFEVFALSAPSSATNANTAKKTNGTTDSLVALPNFTLAATAGTTFASSSLQSNFGTGSGASAGTTGTSTIDVRAIELGFTENTDTAIPIVSGTLTLGADFTGINGSTDLPVMNAGSMRLSGSLQAITNTTESSADPLLGYTNLGVPEPTSLAIFGFGGVVLFKRRRLRVVESIA